MSNWCKNMVKPKPKKVGALKQMCTWCYEKRWHILNFICWLGASIGTVSYARTLNAEAQSKLVYLMCMFGLMSVQISGKEGHLKYVPYIIAIIIIKAMAWS